MTINHMVNSAPVLQLICLPSQDLNFVYNCFIYLSIKLQSQWQRAIKLKILPLLSICCVIGSPPWFSVPHREELYQIEPLKFSARRLLLPSLIAFPVVLVCNQVLRFSEMEIPGLFL